MKTWQQFVEDLQTYARDKESYERATASAEKINSRRSDALKKSKSGRDFTSKMKKKMRDIKNKGQEQRSDYEAERQRSNDVKNKVKNISRRTIKQGAGVFDAGAKVVKKTANLIRNKLRNRQNPN